MRQFKVQYKDNAGYWQDISAPFLSWDEAIARLSAEARNDPEYRHRVVELVEHVIADIKPRFNEEAES